MGLKITQSLKQTQNLAMTPQLQQAIKMLAMTRMEMGQVIQSELMENPLLEEWGDGSIDIEKGEGESDFEGETKELELGDSLNSEVMDQSDMNWEGFLDQFSNSVQERPQSMATPDPDDQVNLEQIYAQGQNLDEYLLWQLQMIHLTPEETKLALEIIYALEDTGQLATPFLEIVEGSSLPLEDAQEILKIVQNFDPVGCASESVTESLLIQLAHYHPEEKIAAKIIQYYLEDLALNGHAKICKELEISSEELEGALKILHGLDPHPGRNISTNGPQYIVPDIFVRETDEGNFEVTVNDEGIPRLKISALYENILRGHLQQKRKKSSLQSSFPDEKAASFVQDKLRSALWLIKSIQTRQSTILKVSNAVCKHQKKFLKDGINFLRPMILKDIALEIGMHESTVSRVSTNKYMHTPQGVYELKYFFNASIGRSKGGADIASEGLRQKIQMYVDHENSRRPLSDQRIVDLLKEENVIVARRTVTKYRELLNILPSSKRKKK